MRKLPPHWWINGPSKPRVASELFRFTHIAGGHAATYRRLLRIGPWSFAVIRYRPGDDPTVPTIPTSDRPAVIGRRGTGRCGGKRQPICALPAGHPGWHRADDGCEWGIPRVGQP